MSGVYCYLGYIFHKDRLQSIVTVSWNGKYRKLCEKPGDIVDKDVLVSKDYGRPNDGIGQTGMDDSLLKDPFPSEIRGGRCFRGVCDADVYNPADSCFFCRIDEYLRVCNGSIVSNLAIRETYPVCVVKS